MVTFKPNPNMSLEEANAVIIDFLSQPNDHAEEIPHEQLQSVIDAVLSIKKIKSGNPNYDRISAVSFLRNRDHDEVQLGGDECARAKNDKMYLTEDHLYQSPYRYSLISLIFHESEHNMQYFKEIDNPCSDFSRKPELASPANVGTFKSTMLSIAKGSNDPAMFRVLVNVFESDYYGQQREIEAYGVQGEYMNGILRELASIMGKGDYETRETLESYERIHSKYLPTGRESRGKRDSVAWLKGRQLIDNFMAQKLDFLTAVSAGKYEGTLREGDIITAVSGIIAGLHYSYNPDTARQILDYVYNMPEDTFTNMSNKAMAINSLITATETPVDMDMMCTLGGLFARLAEHPDNGKIDGRERNMTYSREKFYADYAFYSRDILDAAYGGASHKKVKTL